MADSALSPLQVRHPFAGFAEEIGRSTLRVVAYKELLAISYPTWKEQQLAAELGTLPAPGQSAQFDKGQHLLWTSVGQLLSYAEEKPIGEHRLAERIAKAGYVTDLSDGWIALALEGPEAQARLDLITMPDLADGKFDVGDVTSTVVHHIRVLIWRQTSTRLVLLSPASSAPSLMHHLCEDLTQAPIQAT